MRGSHICDDGNSQVSHVGDDLAVLWWDLSVLDQLVQVLLGDAWTQTQQGLSATFIFVLRSGERNSPATAITL